MKERILMIGREYSVLKEILKYDEFGWSKHSCMCMDTMAHVHLFHLLFV
jgi:hypothetical protein